MKQDRLFQGIGELLVVIILRPLTQNVKHVTNTWRRGGQRENLVKFKTAELRSSAPRLRSFRSLIRNHSLR